MIEIWKILFFHGNRFPSFSNEVQITATSYSKSRTPVNSENEKISSLCYFVRQEAKVKSRLPVYWEWYKGRCKFNLY